MPTSTGRADSMTVPGVAVTPRLLASFHLYRPNSTPKISSSMPMGSCSEASDRSRR